MKKLLLLLILLLPVFTSYGQTDTTIVDTTEYKVYDYVYLKDGKWHRGKITSFDSNTGLIVLETEYGRTYSFTPEQYDYYKKGVLIPVKKKRKKKDFVKLPRKEDAFGFSVALSPSWHNFTHEHTKDDYYETGLLGYASIPFNLSVGAGKFFGRQHYAGLTAGFQLANLSGSDGYFNFGARYAFQYDKNEGNTALSVPVELKFHSYNDRMTYYVEDSMIVEEFTITQYSETLELGVKTIGIQVGHAFDFMINARKSFGLEFFLEREFLVSQRWKNTSESVPEPNATITPGFAFGFAFRFNF